MKEDKFIKENQRVWIQLEDTLKKLKSKGIKSFESSDFELLLTNYNKACGHLSYSRTYYGNSDTTSYLNRLVAAAHSYIYTTETSTVKKLKDFFLIDFPSLIRKNSFFVALSAGLFFLGILLSFIFTLISAENAAAFIPQHILDSVSFEGSSSSWKGPVESTFILTNNIRVGFSAFAMGITLGIGTVYVLVYNGFMLGTLAALALIKGVNIKFWSMILPHGVIELFAIFVCGAAGLIIGYSLINPGNFSRKDSLIIKGRTAIKLVCGTIPLFTVAGFIEGFLTPSGLSQSIKLGFALFTLLLLFLYMFWPLIPLASRNK
ncbi:MAG: stage II sporulation protein M [Clostridia bacterium]|nr:stage II sporulation protein M [Clostridia bacterium]